MGSFANESVKGKKTKQNEKKNENSFESLTNKPKQENASAWKIKYHKERIAWVAY